MQRSGKRIVLFVDNLYQEMEVWYPLYRLREAGAEVMTVGAKAGETYLSKHGYPIHCDKSYNEISASQFDGVVVPGGYAPDHIRRHASANHFVKEMDRQGKLVAAICHAPWFLCSADILNGRNATSSFSIKHDVIHAGARSADPKSALDP